MEPAVPGGAAAGSQTFYGHCGDYYLPFLPEKAGTGREFPAMVIFTFLPQEQAMVDAVTSAFPRVAVVLDGRYGGFCLV